MENSFWETDMEETFIEQLKRDSKTEDFGSEKDNLQIWYNKEGDCLQFKTKQHVAMIGKRIDEYLTLYISLEDGKPIGFQLKDIHALIKELDMDAMAVQAGYVSEDKSLVSITALIFKAFIKRPESIDRIAGYTDAFRAIVKETDNVKIPVCTQ